MCTPTLAVMGLGVVLSAGGQISSGLASSAASKGAAKQYEIQRIETRTATSQAARDRFEEFADLESANQVAIAASGLTPESFAAITEGNRGDALEDAGRIEAEGRIKDARLRFAAAQERQAARGALVGGILGGVTTALSGAAQMIAVGGGGGGSSATKAGGSLVKLG